MRCSIVSYSCFVDGREQRRVLEWFRKKGGGAHGLAEFAHVALVVCRNDNGRNSNSSSRKVALKLKTGHLRHLQVDDQTFGLPFGQGVEKLSGRRVCPDSDTARAQQPRQGLQHGQVVVHDCDPRRSLRHHGTIGVHVADCRVGPKAYNATRPATAGLVKFRPFPPAGRGRRPIVRPIYSSSGHDGL
jgi:hypothetical protein